MAATCSARAADMPAAPPPIAPTVGSFNLFEGIDVHFQAEAGALFNPNNPAAVPNNGPGYTGSGFNFGHFYADHANTPQLNQALLTITKAIDPKATGYAFGFTIQGLYGSDMRTNHYLGIGTFFMGDERSQLNVLQGFGAIHAPIGATASTDIKVGLYSSPMGYETLDPSTTPFYSHSYTYNYAVTFNHTGILSTTHLNPTLDLWLGIDTGNQTTFGTLGDPNGQPAGFVGFGLNGLLNNKLTVLALSHIGPEQNRFLDPYGYKKDLRFYDDVVFTYKINDDWTAVLEGNYGRDAHGYGNGVGGNVAAETYSAVGYLSYAATKDYTFNLRGEVLRDTKNFFVSTPTDNSGLAKVEIDNATGTLVQPLTSPGLGGPLNHGTTYASGTFGLTYKPEVPKPFVLVAVRPEVRYDHIIDGDPLFGRSTGYGKGFGGRDQFTFGGDVIVGF